MVRGFLSRFCRGQGKILRACCRKSRNFNAVIGKICRKDVRQFLFEQFLITFAREIQNKGITAMNFEVFGKSEIEKYKAEIKAKWGNTKEYQDYMQKDIARNGGSYSKIANELLKIFSELGKLKHLTPNADEVQNGIAAIQKFITDNYYECTNKVLSGLGEMYVGDERFRNNIDKAGGDGTADFVKQAIVVYCSKRKV